MTVDTAQLPRSFSEREAQLRALMAKMTRGTWFARPWGNGKTPTGFVNIYCDEAEVTICSLILQDEAAGIVALVNAAEPMLDELERLRKIVHLYVDPCNIRPKHEATVVRCMEQKP